MFRLLFAVITPLSLAACAVTQPPEILTASSPADPHAGIRATGYSNPAGDYTNRVAVEPKDWRQLNAERNPVKGS